MDREYKLTVIAVIGRDDELNEEERFKLKCEMVATLNVHADIGATLAPFRPTGAMFFKTGRRLDG